ncbi:MAG: metallophosphoesterase family protein [Deltaproteobacteria bacterium]|nr:metallophosphoesterase family protein [Deltaproteobacteria bacterium]
MINRKEESSDIFIFGHEHCTVIEHNGNTLYVNPGSPTYFNDKRVLGTVAILDVNAGKADVRFLQL